MRGGAALLTHFGNGSPPWVPRLDNAVQAGLGEDALSASLITDGIHLPDRFVQLVLKVKGPRGVLIVSDAAPVAGLYQKL